MKKVDSTSTFLLITRTDWDEPPRARHQLAYSLVPHGDVVFVSLNKCGYPSLSSKKNGDSILVLSPNWWLPGKVLYRMPLVNEFYQMWLLRKLTKNYTDAKVILFDPSGWITRYYFRNFIYFCNDDFLDKRRAKNWITKLYFKESEKRIARNALYSVGVSKFLVEKLAVFTNRSKLILTGASMVQSVRRVQSTNAKVINLVYVGWLSKIDPSWVVETAKDIRFRIKLIGPYAEKDIAHYKDFDNIEVLGPKTGNELHESLIRSDIGIAPYLKGRDTDLVYTVPNKFWLYLNYGLPIVSHKIQNLFDFPDKFVFEATSPESFKAQIELAHTQDNEELYNKRISFIKSNGWESRAREIIKLFN